MSAALVEQIKTALATLAMPPDRQLVHVQELRVGNDELALEFGDVAGARRGLVSEGVLSKAQADSIGAVEQQLTRISTAGAGRWTDDAVTNGEDWSELRRLAEVALRSLT
jgi:hypothetical protein